MTESIFTRRQGLGIAGLAFLGAALSACSTGTVAGNGGASASAESTDTFPVTIKHAYGETVLTKAAQRPATIAWASGDIALALGVVPAGIPIEAWGGNDKQSTPWADAALEKLGAAWGSGKSPAQYSEADGTNFTEIAKAAPDVILAVQSGLSKEDYEKLSKIAPVIPFPGESWSTGWAEAVTLIGQALGKSAQAKAAIEQTRKLFEDQIAKYPQLKGKTFISTAISVGATDSLWVYSPKDPRSLLLTELGMVPSPAAYPAGADLQKYEQSWSLERAVDLAGDVVVNWTSESGTPAEVMAHPLIGQIPALKKGAYAADTSKTLNLALAVSNPLSLSWSLEKFMPELVKAVDAAGKK